MIAAKSTNGDALIAALHKEFTDEKIKTWEKQIYDNVTYYTHTPDQYYQKAYFNYSIDSDNTIVRFKIVWPRVTDKEISIANVYHGRFIELLLNHIPKHFSALVLTQP